HGPPVWTALTVVTYDCQKTSRVVPPPMWGNLSRGHRGRTGLTCVMGRGVRHCPRSPSFFVHAACQPNFRLGFPPTPTPTLYGRGRTLPSGGVTWTTMGSTQ